MGRGWGKIKTAQDFKAFNKHDVSFLTNAAPPANPLIRGYIFAHHKKINQ